jgi:hypothetical protein
MIKMIIVPNVTRNTNITAVFIFHVVREEAEEESGGCAMSKEKSRLDDHGHYREKKRIVRCEEMDKRDDRFV